MTSQDEDSVSGEVWLDHVVVTARKIVPRILPKESPNDDVYFSRGVFLRFIEPHGRRNE